MKIKEYEQHPLGKIMPPMSSGDLASLAVDITAHGLIEPIRLLDGKVFDGWHRYQACRKAQVNPRFVQVSGQDKKNPIALVSSLNLERRHLDASQRSLIGAELMDLAKGNGAASKTTQKEAAEAAGISVAGLKHGKTVQDKAVLEVREAVKSGKLAVHRAAKLAKLPKTKQLKIAKGGVKAMEQATKPQRGGLFNESRLDQARDAAAKDTNAIKRLLAKLDSYWDEAKRTIATQTPGTVFNACRAIVEEELQ
jgi:hypothetical protein